MDSIAESQAKLTLYEHQLGQVNDMLAFDMMNPQFQQLKADLNQVIALTKDLIRNTALANSVVAQSSFVEAKPKAQPPRPEAPAPTTNEIDIVKSGPIEIGEVVEVSGGDRVYAGVVTGIINETEYKVKYFEYDSEVTLPMDSLSRIQPTYPLLKPQSSIKIGMTIRCKYSADQQFYEAIVTEITTVGYKVIFPAYGNGEEVPYEYLTQTAVAAEAQAAEEGAEQASSSAGKAATTGTKDSKKASGDPSSALIPIPSSLEILPTDTEEEKIRKKKKIKAIKSKNRLISKDVEVQEMQRTWQNFVTKAAKKKTMTGPIVKKASSMFKSDENVEGKVGVTNSGKAMTTFGARKKYTFQDAPLG